VANKLTLSEAELRRRMMGCWLGKAVGGTLGMPYEGVRDALSLTYYDPVPKEMEPNDDLDLQVVYAFLLDRMDEPRVDRHGLLKMWDHVGMSPDEYGVSKRNRDLGLVPPATGSYDNWFTDGMGAAIRTEIWACLAPGDPKLAAAYAYEDACLDHAGEGIYAAQWLAALQSLAFVESDRETLLDQSLTVIPEDSSVRRAIEDVRQWWPQHRDWLVVQQLILQHYGSDNFTDVTMNLAFIVLGWLAGEGDFGKTICAAVNCGQDTDCTGATLGALLGIIDPDSVDEQWLKPIGRELVLTPSVTGVEHPPTLDGFTDQVIRLRERIAGRKPNVETVEQPTDHLAIKAEIAFADLPWVEATETAPPMPDPIQNVTFPGTVVDFPFNRFEKRVLFVRYRIHIDRDRKVWLLFNTDATASVYLNNKLAFAREGGWVCPAFHRAPLHQAGQYDLKAGVHEVLALLERPTQIKDVQWTIGVADGEIQPVCAEWVVDAFERVGLS